MWFRSTGTSMTPSLSPAVTRTHNVLRKARTNLEVSLPWRPVWDGVGVPVLMPWGWTQMAHTLWWLLQSAEGQLGEACGGHEDTFSLSVLSQHVHVPRAQ